MIYMSEFDRLTGKVESNATLCGCTTFDEVVLIFGSDYVSRGERSMIYHTSETRGLVFADHDMFSVDYPVNKH